MDEQNTTEAKKDLMPIGSNDLAPTDQFGAATGFDDVDKDCLSIPYLRLCQAGTDFVKRGSAKYIPGLQPGQFFSPLTREIFGEEMRLVIVKFYRSYSVYESRESSAKFIGVMTPEQYESAIEPTAVREKSYTLDPDGHRYVDSRNFVLIDYDHPERGPMIFSMSSTGIKPSKNWLTQSRNVKVKNPDGSLRDAPIWSSVWRVVAGYFDDPKGSYYQVSAIERLGWVKAGPVADGYRKVFEEFQKYDATAIAAPAEETPAGEVATSAAPPAASPAASAVAGAMGGTIVRGEDEDELF